MTNNTFLDTVNLNNPADLLKAISYLTDGVYNTSDTASFNDNDILFINKVKVAVGKILSSDKYNLD